MCRHHEFLWCNILATILNNQSSFLYNNGTTILHICQKNSKWQRLGSLNEKTANIHIHIFRPLKLSLHFLEKK